MASEDNRMSGWVKRYARVGTSVGGLAARVAGQRYLGIPVRRAMQPSCGVRSAGLRGR